MDDVLLPVMDDLRACLCAGMEAADTTGCFCGLYPGPLVSSDFCSCKGGGGCGMGWVRLVRAYPAGTSYPSQDQKPGGCVVVVAAVLEVGINRCLPVPDRQGKMDPAALVNAAIAQIQDAGILLRALQCCDSLRRLNPLLGVYQPAVVGDCGGGTWPVTIQVMRR